MGRRAKHPICDFDMQRAMTQDIVLGLKCRVCGRYGLISRDNVEQILGLQNNRKVIEK